jgi:hypothetical protein
VYYCDTDTIFVFENYNLKKCALNHLKSWVCNHFLSKHKVLFTEIG